MTPARSALTLIELLVVIAILATCIAFLLPLLFEASVDLTSEAFDPCAWFEAPDASVDAIFSAMQRSLALQQHGDVANYAYADGHVCAIPVSAVRAWAEDRFNFALRNRGEYRDRS